MKAKNKIKYTFYLGEIRVKTYIPKSRKLRKKIVETGNCSIKSCQKVIRNKYKIVLHAYNYGMSIQKMTAIF